jgi:hypothetical protein
MTLEEKQRLFVEGLKFLGTAITAAVAVYSCLTDGMKTIRRGGHLLNKGRWLIALALGGAALSGTIQIFEYVDALDNASQMSRRFETLIRTSEEISEPVDVNRIQFDATLTWAAADNHFAAFRKRVSEYYEDAMKRAREMDSRRVLYDDPSTRAQLFLPKRTLMILTGSALWPSSEIPAERSAFDTLNAVGLVVTVCRGKPKAAPESEPLSQSDSSDARLFYPVEGDLSRGSIGRSAKLFYRPGGRRESKILV